MTIDLVDGHAGKPHISGEDLGDFKAGFIGQAGYVFKRANMLAITLNSANSVTIDTGSGIMPNTGRHFRVTEPETLTITSGTQGQNRNDLIVVRQNTTTEEDSTSIESAEIVVVRGTPTSDTATDPEIQDGDLLLYRVSLSGVSVSEPEPLFSVFAPVSELWDSISQITDFIVDEGISGKWYYRKWNSGICDCFCNHDWIVPNNSSDVSVTLPFKAVLSKPHAVSVRAYIPNGGTSNACSTRFSDENTIFWVQTNTSGYTQTGTAYVIAKYFWK